MAMDEKALNACIAQAMERQAPRGYSVQAEQHGQARQGNASPDIVVRMPYGLRTIVETEYGAPALGDAKSRLGYEFSDYTLPMKSVLAVGIPRPLGELGFADLDRELMSDTPQFLMQVVTGQSDKDPNIKITPARPVAVSLRDLVQYAWLAAIPEAYAAEVVGEVVANLKTAQAELSQRLRLSSPAAQDGLVDRYGNHDSANGMDSVAGNVVGTLASMIQLHINLKQWGNVDYARDIAAPELWQRVAPHNGIPGRIAAEWRKIEVVDYMPLSTIAAAMLEDSELGPKLGGTLKAVHETMSGYLHAGISATTNVVAEIWQALIPDRDQRAAYYTKPAVAELLANLTTARLASPAAARYNEICAGTGTLARATEENIRFRHYANPDHGKDSIHARRMERCIQLTDINPQSISVATANMASLEPETTFGASSIFAVTAAGGSLNFLTAEGVANMDDELVGRNGAQGEMLVIDPRTVDIICNNDPYFRPRGGAKSPISAKAMLAYRRSADGRMKGVANGQAGLATFMQVIEHEMLGYGSPHGKVLPLTAAHAETYTGFRRNIEHEYCDVIAISTASGDGASMSADTGIQEMLLIGSKHRVPEGILTGSYGDRAVACVNLTTTFTSKLEAKMFADAIRREIAAGKPSGEINVGGVVGTYYRMTGLGAGKPWSALGVSGDYAILANHVIQGRAWNPATGKATDFALPMTTASGVSAKGPTHDLLGCLPGSRAPRGAFTMYPPKYARSVNNPSLWELQAGKQVTMTCVPTHYGEPRGDAGAAERMRQTAGHFHLSRNLRMSAQKIAMAYTEQECLGGRSWTTIKADQGVAEAMALFLNSTYGMLIRIGYGQSTDLGRSPIQVRAIDNHPIPDFASASDAGKAARRIAVDNFDRLRKLPLERISLSALDANRAEIDRVVTLMLGLGWNPETENMLDAWRRLMCLQPGVNANNLETLARLARAGIANSSHPPPQSIADFCRRNRINRLALLGPSMPELPLPGNPVRMLVEFDPGQTLGFAFFRMQDELGEMFGRLVNLNTPKEILPEIRQQVMAEAENLYVAPR